MRTRQQRLLNAVQRPDVYEEVLIDSGGVPVVLSVWRAGPNAPVVLFLPGTMTHPLFYEELLDAVNRAGLNVVGLHPQAHGKSPRMDRPLTFPALVQNGHDALTWLQGEFPDAPTVVMGSSQGGVLAMALAARNGLAGVVAHNVLDPELPSSLGVTRLPTSLGGGYDRLRRALTAAAAVAPGLPVPFEAYLDMDRVSRDPELVEFFHTDPLGRRSYPLGFLAGLVNADLSVMRDGSIRCPVVVLAAAGERLFRLDHVREVFDRIAAPDKQLVVLETDRHLVFNEALDVTLPVLLPLLVRLTR